MAEDETQKLYNRIVELHKQLGGDAFATDTILNRLEALEPETILCIVRARKHGGEWTDQGQREERRGYFGGHVPKVGEIYLERSGHIEFEYTRIK